jgi:hypothetical protein
MQSQLAAKGTRQKVPFAFFFGTATLNLHASEIGAMSFSGYFTRMDMGHSVICAAGNGASRSSGLGWSVPSQRSFRLGGDDQGRAVVNISHQ